MSIFGRPVAPFEDSRLAKEGILEPLISTHTESTNSDPWNCSADDYDERHNKSFVFRNLTQRNVAVFSVLGVLAHAGIATSVAAMVPAQSIIAYVAGGICIINSLLLPLKQTEISKEKVLQKSIRDLNRQREEEHRKLNVLTISVHDLSVEANSMKNAEEELQQIAQQQYRDAADIVALTKENEFLLNERKGYLRQNFVMELARVLTESDSLSEDMKVKFADLSLLTLRLQVQLNQYGIELNKSKFEQMVLEDNRVLSLLKFCENLLCNEYIEGELETENMHIAIVQTKFSKGSVDVARGQRLSLFKKKARNNAVSKAEKDITQVSGETYSIPKSVIVTGDALPKKLKTHNREQDSFLGSGDEHIEDRTSKEVFGSAKNERCDSTLNALSKRSNILAETKKVGTANMSGPARQTGERKGVVPELKAKLSGQNYDQSLTPSRENMVPGERENLTAPKKLSHLPSSSVCKKYRVYDFNERRQEFGRSEAATLGSGNKGPGGVKGLDNPNQKLRMNIPSSSVGKSNSLGQTVIDRVKQNLTHEDGTFSGHKESQKLHTPSSSISKQDSLRDTSGNKQKQGSFAPSPSSFVSKRDRSTDVRGRPKLTSSLSVSSLVSEGRRSSQLSEESSEKSTERPRKFSF